MFFFIKTSNRGRGILLTDSERDVFAHTNHLTAMLTEINCQKTLKI